MSRARLAPSLAPRADRANLTPKLSTLDKWCRALEGVGVEFIDVIVEHSPGVRLQKGNAPRQEDVRRNQQDHHSHEPAGRPALGPAHPLGPREDPSLLQRYIAHFPAAGEIILFDRSWYNPAGRSAGLSCLTSLEPRRP